MICIYVCVFTSSARCDWPLMRTSLYPPREVHRGSITPDYILMKEIQHQPIGTEYPEGPLIKNCKIPGITTCSYSPRNSLGYNHGNMPFLTTSYPKIEISLYQVPWFWFLKDSEQVTLHARSPDPHCPLLTEIDFLQQSDSMEKKLHVSKWFNLYKHKKVYST